MYSFMTVPQLKDELKKRKASAAAYFFSFLDANYDFLLYRLEAYDRNANFGAEEVEEDEAYNAPAAEYFGDINGKTPLPPITKQLIQAFIERFQAQLKGRQMYEERFLLTARAAADGDFTFIQGQCKAQMKKILYVVDVKLNPDGSIEQSHCECAAGSGVEAHCKHVLVLLHGVEDMVRTKNMLLHQVCTQKLMAFKRPRKVYFDSPKQAQKLPCRRTRSVNYLPLKEEDMMENYNDHIKNTAVSYGNTTMPILQTIRPANTYAVENT
ncbi:unnamed protein product [Pieris brassicae]|uniref:SWIM-type domain-containing protein n=1 Tax=Pieris brassicae TaxID=7116 RepID=A0A9P0TG65_PIEBR|nr:unnamed protein product [Pieris brassicae]